MRGIIASLEAVIVYIKHQILLVVSITLITYERILIAAGLCYAQHQPQRQVSLSSKIDYDGATDTRN